MRVRPPGTWRRKIPEKLKEAGNTWLEIFLHAQDRIAWRKCVMSLEVQRTNDYDEIPIVKRDRYDTTFDSNGRRKWELTGHIVRMTKGFIPEKGLTRTLQG